MSEVYHSSTLGPIPLSFTGRRLLQNLREEVTALLKKAYRNGEQKWYRDGANPVSAEDWEPLSKARGELAKYMSKLESERWPSDYAPAEHVNFKCNGGHRAASDRRPTMYDLAYTAWKQKQDAAPAPTPPVASPQRTFTINLPPVPEGYVLEVVGDLLTMRPLEKPKRKKAKGNRIKK